MRTEQFDAKWGPDGEMYTHRYYGDRKDVISKVYDQGVAVIASLTEDEPTSVESFFDMDKPSMIEHLVTIHKMDRVADKAMSTATGTKATKEELVAAHNKAHATIDNPMSEFNTGRYDNDTLNRAANGQEVKFFIGGTPVPTVKHTHQAPVVVSTGDRNNTPAGAKPLSAAEATVLKEVVNNDFAGLKQEMQAFAHDALQQQKQEIGAEWDEKEAALPDYAANATKIKRKHDEKVAALRAKFEKDMKEASEKFEDAFKEITEQAKGDNVALTAEQESYVDDQGQKKTRPVYKAVFQGRNEALAAAEAENKKFLDRALLTLEAQRLTAQRQVLVSRINPEGARILDTIPDAKTAMLEAQRTSTRPVGEITSA